MKVNVKMTMIQLPQMSEKHELQDVEFVEADSPKLKAAKQKIKPVHEMRYVECNTAFQDYEDLYELLLLCLKTIVQKKRQKEMGCKVHIRGIGTASLNQDPCFHWYILQHLFGLTLGLNYSLQGSTQCYRGLQAC